MATKCIAVEVLIASEKPLGPDWRKDRFLWKPEAEHYKGVVVLTLPIGKVASVITYSIKTNKKIKTLKFRPHTGDEAAVGDAWADYTQDGAWYKKNYPEGILVKVTSKDKKVRTFKLTCPQKRSDGK